MKRCGGCGEDRDEASYGLRNAQSGRPHTVCIFCRRAYCRKYYHKDPRAYYERKKLRATAYRRRARSYLLHYLADHPCVDCGIADPVVLEFDHVRGRKRKALAIMVSEAPSLETIREEIAKCVVRCANCHRRKTARSRGYWKLFAPAGVVPGDGP